MARVILDTSVIVGDIDDKDSLHAAAKKLVHELRRLGAELIMLDCVAVESIGVLCRRRKERRKRAALPDFAHFDGDLITRTYHHLQNAWGEILREVRTSDGLINAHDALILHHARREKIAFIASFDVGLRDRGPRVLASAEEATVALEG